MVSCLFAAKYTMTAEVYNQITIQEESGSIKRNWDYDHPLLTIDCDGRVLSAAGSRVSFIETWGEQYSNSRFVNVTCNIKLDNRQRLGRLKAKNDWLLEESTVYDILGVYPTIDPFGAIMEYTILAAEVMNSLQK